MQSDREHIAESPASKEVSGNPQQDADEQVGVTSAKPPSDDVPQAVNLPAQEPRPEIRREMNDFERSTIRLAKVAVLLSAATGLFICLQWCEMHTGGNDTHTLAVTAGTQADVANQTMQIDQRPWMNVVFGQAGLKDGSPIVMPVRIINSGKTPAYNVQGIVVVNLLSGNDQPDFNYGSGIHPKYSINTGIAIPNFPNDLQWAILPKYVARDKPINPIVATSAIRKGIEDGRLYIAVYGRITYADTFGTDHWINFCSYAHNAVGVSDKATADTCGPYNDVDKNYQRKKLHSN